MIRLSKTADYGILLLAGMARQEGDLYTAAELSSSCHLSQPTVAKVLKLLARAGLVESERGAHGGYRLARRPNGISVADAICAVDGPIAVTECVDDTPGLCSVEADCAVRGNWTRINAAVEAALQAVSIAEMAANAVPDYGHDLVQLGDSKPETTHSEGQTHAHGN